MQRNLCDDEAATSDPKLFFLINRLLYKNLQNRKYQQQVFSFRTSIEYIECLFIYNKMNFVSIRYLLE